LMGLGFVIGSGFGFGLYYLIQIQTFYLY